jgi:hypothetical protein
VLVNREAQNHMQKGNLAARSTFVAMRDRGDHNIADFPQGAVTIKAIWRLVKQRSSLKVGIWRPEVAVGHDSLAESDWPAYAFVDSTNGPSSTPVALPAGGIPQAGHIGVSYFYSLRVTPEMKFEVRSAAGEPPIPGDELILVGLHISTKSIPDWLWMTAWWSGQQPPPGTSMSAPWCNYAMDITLSMLTPRHDPDGPPPAFKAIFNPYLEAASTRGLYSNCMTCHVAAGYCNERPDPSRAGQSIAFSALEKIVRTDYVWTLGRRLGDSPQSCN